MAETGERKRDEQPASPETRALVDYYRALKTAIRATRARGEPADVLTLARQRRLRPEERHPYDER